MKPDDDLLNQSTLTNDETELDPAVAAQFREYEKVIAALSAKVDNLTQLVQSNNKPEEQPVVTTSDNMSAANNSNILTAPTPVALEPPAHSCLLTLRPQSSRLRYLSNMSRVHMMRARHRLALYTNVFLHHRLPP
ncbi:hypothetical protein TKK_0016605 [Trichogramma kaykai]